jgi:large conductance mechanosensitive channel
VNIGVFINSVINFAIVAFAIFWVVKAMSRFVAREKAAPGPPPHSEVLLEQIRDTLVERLPAPPIRSGAD